jgi:hypothetical protein
MTYNGRMAGVHVEETTIQSRSEKERERERVETVELIL